MITSHWTLWVAGQPHCREAFINISATLLDSFFRASVTNSQQSGRWELINVSSQVSVSVFLFTKCHDLLLVSHTGQHIREVETHRPERSPAFIMSSRMVTQPQPVTITKQSQAMPENAQQEMTVYHQKCTASRGKRTESQKYRDGRRNK